MRLTVHISQLSSKKSDRQNPTEIFEAVFRIDTVANLPHTPWFYGLADAPQATTL